MKAQIIREVTVDRSYGEQTTTIRSTESSDVTGVLNAAVEFIKPKKTIMTTAQKIRALYGFMQRGDHKNAGWDDYRVAFVFDMKTIYLRDNTDAGIDFALSPRQHGFLTRLYDDTFPSAPRPKKLNISGTLEGDTLTIDLPRGAKHVYARFSDG